MSQHSEEPEQSQAPDEGPTMGIGDEDLPEDLVPGEDNPLAEPLADDVSEEDLGMGTPGPGSSGDGSGSGDGDDGDSED